MWMYRCHHCISDPILAFGVRFQLRLFNLWMLPIKKCPAKVVGRYFLDFSGRKGSPNQLFIHFFARPLGNYPLSIDKTKTLP